jgi:hypothetical protein
MYAVTLPGFTAESSLSGARGPYAAAARPGAAGVVPAMASVLPRVGLGDTGGGRGDDAPECILRCYWRCGRYGCFPTNCYWLCF